MLLKINLEVFIQPMLLTDEENLREVQVFPPNVSGMDLLMGSPSELDESQLRELHIKIRD